MQQKYDTYKRYDWPGDKNWQQYLNNLYPIPSRDKVEKIRRKWYQKNKAREQLKRLEWQDDNRDLHNRHAREYKARVKNGKNKRMPWWI